MHICPMATHLITGKDETGIDVREDWLLTFGMMLYREGPAKKVAESIGT